jgi:tetratricopeptide (TPR) repeat protein
MRQLLGSVATRILRRMGAPVDRAMAPGDPTKWAEQGAQQQDAGNLAGAEKCFIHARQAGLDTFELNQRWGVLCVQMARHRDAVRHFARALEIEPDNHFALANLSIAYSSDGRLVEAEQALQRALALKPDWSTGHTNLGALYAMQRRMEQAEEAFRRAVQLDPRNVGALNNLAGAARERGALADAEALYRRALDLAPGAGTTWTNLAVTLEGLERYDEATAASARALEINNGDASAHSGLARAHQRSGAWVDAEAAFRRALVLDPNSVDATDGLVSLLTKARHFDEATELARSAMVRRAGDVNAMANVAMVLLAAKSLDEAESIAKAVIAIDPDHASANLTLGNVARARHDDATAEAIFRRVVATHPRSGSARYDLATTLLMRGRHEEGFALYDSRFDAFAAEYTANPDLAPWLAMPRRWTGESISGKRVVLWSEQGFGDAIMMLRCVPAVRAAGASRITVVMAPPLARLVSTSGLADAVITGANMNADSFDVHAPLMSVPAMLPATALSLCRPPYFNVPQEMREAWNSRIGSLAGLKVGVVWASSPGFVDAALRDVPQALFSRLANVETSLVSLQKDKRPGESVAPKIGDFMSDCADFLDTAALIAGLDAIVTVDTAVAHLAGALGKPVLMLNRVDSDWRWGRTGDITHWYPSMRIIRQVESGKWDIPFREVEAHLSHIAAMMSPERGLARGVG